MLQEFLKHEDQSRKSWAMTHGAGGRQSDSPAGRFHDKKALEAFTQLTDKEKAQLDPEVCRRYEEEAKFAQDELS